jgi:hypothetical protein
MKLLISIILTIIFALTLSGCVIVEGRWHFPYRHRHHRGVTVTHVPPPPVVIVEPAPPPGPPRHRSVPRPGGRRDLRR